MSEHKATINFICLSNGCVLLSKKAKSVLIFLLGGIALTILRDVLGEFFFNNWVDLILHQGRHTDKGSKVFQGVHGF